MSVAQPRHCSGGERVGESTANSRAPAEAPGTPASGKSPANAEAMA
jgi:hypothetical protein